MVQLKFRAWNGKQMFLSPSEVEHLGSWFDVHAPGALYKGGVVFMQCTPMKDKNGRSIYEGDIVCSGKTTTGTLIAWPVVFHFDSWAIGGGNNNPHRPNKGFWKRTEVIGNIYENHELLTQQTTSGK